jgi:ferritin-like metal-binding protein YciE
LANFWICHFGTSSSVASYPGSLRRGKMDSWWLTKKKAQTKGQVTRLEQISQIVGKKLTGKSCAGMKGVLEEGSEVLEDTHKGEVRDVALISASQRVEHYEMAGYGSARDFAKQLGLSDVAQLLDETLAEEKAADKLLTGIAKSVNKNATKAG